MSDNLQSSEATEDTEYFPGQHADGSDVSSDAAQSFIGGSSVISAHPEHHHQETSSKDEQLENSQVTTDDLESSHYKNEHKIFTFSLPFGGNAIHFPSIKQIRQNLPIIGSNDTDDRGYDPTLSRHEIKQKLKRQQSVSTIEESFLFKDLKGVDNGRFRAVKKAFTPAISIPSLIDEKRKKESVWDQIEGEVVILGGYRGSVLKETETNNRLWIPSFKTGLNLNKKTLLIGPNDEDEIEVQKHIYSPKTLNHVGPVDITRKLRAKLTNGKTNVHTFGYDWRLSCDISSQKVIEFLAKLKCNQGSNPKGAIVIAHSMGGLVAHHAMQQRPDLFRGLIYVGVPSMCPNVLGPIRYGDTVLFNNKILTPEINFFMRSSFVFLPEDGRCFIDKKTHEQYNLDYFDPQTWVEYNLSPAVAKSRQKASAKAAKLEPVKSPILKGIDSFDMKRSLSLRSSHKSTAEEFNVSFDESYAYLSRTLKRTKKFLDDLKYDPEKKYPPLAIVYGDQVPTVRGARVDGVADIKNGNYDDFFYGPGDGVVHHKWLMPERRGFPVAAKLSSGEGHISLMTDLETMGDALFAVLQEEKARLSARDG